MLTRTPLLLAAVVLMTVTCDDGSSDTANTGPGSDPAPTNDVPDAPSPTGGLEAPVEWEFAGSVSGALRQIVPWSEGFAALHFPDADDLVSGSARGDLWYSSDGIDWDPALVPQELQQVDTLAGHDGDLFALAGDTSDPTEARTLWHRSSGTRWRKILSHELLQHIAIGADRVVAYRGSPFEVVAVHDATTLEPAEFNGIPEIERPSEIPEPGRPPDLDGGIIGLDDGFLARVGWGRTTVGTTDRSTWLLYSADGSTWSEHPAEATDGVEVGNGESIAPAFDGLNLLTADRNRSDGLHHRLLIDRWEYVPGSTDDRAPQSWVTDTGIDLQATAPAVIAMASATERGFFDVVEGAIRHSPDGVTWRLIDAPPTWSGPTVGGRGLVAATILDGTDGLVAVGVHGTLDSFVPEDLATEFWTAE